MKCTRIFYIESLKSAGAPWEIGLDRNQTIPQLSHAMAVWFFVRNNSDPDLEKIKQLVREYLLELDDKGFVEFAKI